MGKENHTKFNFKDIQEKKDFLIVLTQFIYDLKKYHATSLNIQKLIFSKKNTIIRCCGIEYYNKITDYNFYLVDYH